MILEFECIFKKKMTCKKDILLILSLVIVENLIIYQIFLNHTPKNIASFNESNDLTWKNTPSLTILCRTYSGLTMELYNVLIVSYLLFWPYNDWKNSDLVLVFDDEKDMDHRFATVLANLPPFPRIFFEKHPRKEKTFCSDWRGEGYSRQQYSNFYADLYSDHEYIGLLDSDTFFATQVTPEDLFIDGKPRMFGYNACCSSWVEATPVAIGGEMVGEFMVVNGFPVIIKRKHFSLIRQHITEKMKAANFEDAFLTVCSNFSAKYSQFDLMAHYLWNFKREEYSWHLNDWENSKFNGYNRRMSTKTEALDMNRPIVSLMKQAGHFGYSADLFKLIYDYICTASELKAGDCESYASKGIILGAKKNLFVDWTFVTANWTERDMPHRPTLAENPWSKENFSWQDAYNLHIKNVKNREISSDKLKWKLFD